MVKCGACGKFLSPTKAAKCHKCRFWYHRLCAGINHTDPLLTSWFCPECKKNLPRDNQAETPVGGQAPAAMEESVGNEMDTSTFNNTALDTTQELALDLRTELKMFKEELLAAVRAEFQLLRDNLAELRSSLKATNDRMSNLEERVAVMESKCEQSQNTSNIDEIITTLRSDINDREQELLANDIQIANLPEISGENPIHTALLIATKVGVKIKARDIVSAERVGGRRINATQPEAPAETRPRFLVVRLARRDLRDELLEGARVRRGMTSADLDLPGVATRFYVNERLTKLNRELFRRAREAGSRLGWQFIWSKRGRILARYKLGDSACLIRNEADLQRVFGSNQITDDKKVA